MTPRHRPVRRRSFDKCLTQRWVRRRSVRYTAARSQSWARNPQRSRPSDSESCEPPPGQGADAAGPSHAAGRSLRLGMRSTARLGGGLRGRRHAAHQSVPACCVYVVVVDVQKSVVIDRAIPLRYPAHTPRRDAGSDARITTGSTPAGGDAGTTRTPREPLQRRFRTGRTRAWPPLSEKNTLTPGRCRLSASPPPLVE